MAQVSIITIGDELLIGQVVDTNSAWIAQELNKAGLRVKRRVAVGDVWDEIWQALDEESAHAEIILITGGLGPTADDITKPLLCKYFDGKLITDEGALANVKYLFEKIFKRELTTRNIKQSEVPDVCTVLQNKRGTAPGMLFNKAGKVYISMPGVPHEMQGMMTDDVIPFLQSRFNTAFIAHRTLLTFGIGESTLADLVQQFEESLRPELKLAYLPNYGMVRLRLTGTGADEHQIVTAIDKQFLLLQTLVKDYLVTNEDEPMEKVLAKMLAQKNKTLSTAESCTGGYIAHLITSLPGSSRFYQGSIVSYANRIKTDMLNVNKATLGTDGAVSEAVVLQMVKGALRQLKTDYAIAVSGIMGPEGGSDDKPVGSVWVAVGDAQNQVARKFYFRFSRQRNIQLTAVNALNMMREFVLQHA